MPAGTRNIPAPRWIVIVWELAFLALIINIVVSSLNVNLLIRNQDKITHTRQRQADMNALLSTMKDAETGHRGYVLTGRDEFLEPYSQARNVIWHRCDELIAETVGEAIQQERLAELRLLLEKKMMFMQQSIDLRRNEGYDAARDLILQRQGKTVMDQIREKVAELLVYEDVRLQEQNEDALAYFRLALATAIGGGALTLGMVALAFVLIRRELLRREAVEADLRGSEERFRVLAELMPQMVWVTRPDGHHTYFNPRWYDYTGLSQGESQGQGWSLPLHPDDRERSRTRWMQSLASGDPYEIEYRFRAGDGSYRWFLGRAHPQRDERGRVVRWIGTCTDIDDAKRQAETLEEQVRSRTAQLLAVNTALRAEIEEREKAESRSQALLVELQRSNEELEKFAYVASHDLQEPLRKIQAFGDLLERKYRQPLGEQGVMYIERLVASATRMRKLIEDLLTFSRVTTRGRSMMPVNLAVVVEEVLADLDNQVVRTGGQVQVAPLPKIEADPVQMRQLFQNLIGNALKFHQPNRPPLVSIEVETVADDPGRCRILFHDNGIGFEEVYLDRIFQMFQRLHGRGEYEGTGMGLAICRKIVERHGGTITARSKVGKGTTFIVELPVQSPLRVEGVAS